MPSPVILARRERLPELPNELPRDRSATPRHDFAHSGLVLATLLKQQKCPDSKSALISAARRAQRFAQPVYQAAFTRRGEMPNASSISFQLQTPPTQRIAVGLGNESPLGIGITLNHTYGTPLIPGSGLKGLAARYCRQVLGQADGELELRRDVVETIEGQARRRIGLTYQTLFGDQRQAGFLEFLDAWIHPDSLTNRVEGLQPDVITPHHQEYYSGRIYANSQLTDNLKIPGTDFKIAGTRVPPTDFDSPKPVPFLSVRGRFEFRLGWNGDPQDAHAAAWLNWTRDLLTAALADWGIGGKTNSGYGRLVPCSTS